MNEIPTEQVQESLQDHQLVTNPETGETKVRVKSVPSARRADALRLVAEGFLQQEATRSIGGDRHQVVVHVSAETLRSGAAGSCEFEGGPSMAAETVRRIACDASVVALIEDEDGEPLSVGRKTRTISAPLRRLLNARDKGCRFPGCANTRHVDAHHIEHWANGGETKPSNLVSLCSFHHRKVHEGGMQIHVLDDGALRFIKLDGTAIDSVASGCTQPLSDWTEIPEAHRERGIRIDERTAATRWRGERCDYGLGLRYCLRRRSAAERQRRSAFQRKRNVIFVDSRIDRLLSTPKRTCSLCAAGLCAGFCPQSLSDFSADVLRLLNKNMKSPQRYCRVKDRVSIADVNLPTVRLLTAAFSGPVVCPD